MQNPLTDNFTSNPPIRDELPQRGFLELFVQAYHELRMVARRQIRKCGNGDTSQGTALVHDVFLRMSNNQSREFSKQHFMRAAARSMRHVLVDHGIRNRRSRLRGEFQSESSSECEASPSHSTWDRAALHEALWKLARQDARLAAVTELHYFAGLKHQQIAELLQVNCRTVERDLVFAKAWLLTQIQPKVHQSLDS